MNIRTKTQGHSLLELMIATGILSVVMVITYDFMRRTSDHIALVTEEAFLQSKAQYAVERMTDLLRESSAIQVTIFRVQDPPGGTIVLPNGTELPADHDCLVFPHARRQSDNVFIYIDGGTVLPEPFWQGLAVIAPFEGNLYLYRDYRNAKVRNYDTANPIRVSALTATQITLTDGTVFTRGSTVNRELLMSNYAQMLIPNYDPTDPVHPWAAATLPMQMQVIALTELRGGVAGSRLVASATMWTEVLARNEN